MDANMIVSMISSVGFPIACCLIMFYWTKYTTDQNRETTKELNEQHNKEMLAFKDEIKEALNNNTIALTRLCDKLGKED